MSMLMRCDEMYAYQAAGHTYQERVLHDVMILHEKQHWQVVSSGFLHDCL